jgi:hypothetical protein
LLALLATLELFSETQNISTMQCVKLVPNGNENVTNLFQLAKKVTNLFQIANKSDELIPNGSVEPVPIDKSCRLYSIWDTFELIPNGCVGLVQPPLL